MQANGYTKASSYSGIVRKPIRDYLRKLDFFSPEVIKRNIASTYRLAKKQKDITNMNRNLEHQAKIAGMITNKEEVIGNDEKIVVIYGNKPVEKTEAIEAQGDKDTQPS